MNAKKLALFGGSGVIVAGCLLYAFGIYPPSSGRAGQGAIGQRQVYRAEQPKDASVNPDAAPVAMAAITAKAANRLPRTPQPGRSTPNTLPRPERNAMPAPATLGENPAAVSR